MGESVGFLWENLILDSLEDLSYGDGTFDSKRLADCVKNGSGSVEFTGLVEWATTELASFVNIDDHVSAIKGPQDSETFEMELSGFLREYGCPYSNLIEGPIAERLSTVDSRFKLLSYLLSELQAVRMITVHKPHLVPTKSSKPEGSTNDAASHMKAMLIALGFPKPPDGVTSFQLFSKVENKVKSLVDGKKTNPVNRPMLKARLTDKQWDTVQYINHALRQEYECRRQMLMQRLDVTMLSFQWSDQAKKTHETVKSLYSGMRQKMSVTSGTDIPQLLASREDLLQIEKTSGEDIRKRMKCEINRVLIGSVPDRGGRAYEMEPPPPEMPSFQQRQQQAPMQQRGGGRGGTGDSRGRGGSCRGRDGGHAGGGWGGQSQAAFVPMTSDNPAAKFFGGSADSYNQQQQFVQQQQGEQDGYNGGGGGRGGRGGWGGRKRGHNR